MKYMFLLLICFIASSAIAQYVGLQEHEVSALKNVVKGDSSIKKLYSSLKRIADAALDEQPNPIDTVVSEGHLATDPKKIITQRSLQDINKINALAIVYKIENSKKYLDKLI